MSVSNLLKTARMTEREGDDDKAAELYAEVVASYPGSKEAQEAGFDLDDLRRKKEAKEQPQQATYNQTTRPDVVHATVVSGGVSVVDVNMPFWSMVSFMVKFSIASIPALIILTIFSTVIFAVLGGMFGIGQFR
jgi:hypothetical protein